MTEIKIISTVIHFFFFIIKGLGIRENFNILKSYFFAS